MESIQFLWILNSALRAGGIVFCFYLSIKILASTGKVLPSLFVSLSKTRLVQTLRRHYHPAHHSGNFPDGGNNFENRITVFIQYSKILPNESVYTSTTSSLIQTRRSSSTESADDLPLLFSSMDFTLLLKRLQEIETITSQWSLVLRVECVDFIGHIQCGECQNSGDIKPVIVLQSISFDANTLPIEKDLGCEVFQKVQSHWKECYIYNMLEDDKPIYGHQYLS